MILVLEKGITQDQKKNVRSILFSEGYIVREMSEAGQNVIGAVGQGSKETEFFEKLPGVSRVIPISTSFKLVSRQMHTENTTVQVGNVAVGGERITIIAGPCAIESRDQALKTAREVKRYGAVLFRGGAFKPRTSPYSFQGLQEEGLKILAEVRAVTGLGVVTEITSPAQADMMMKYVDVVQIGARNMQNFELLKCVGRIGKPVVLKRGLSSTIEEWLMSAEYILSEGNDNVILCERGIRTFEPYTRNTLDLSAIPVVKTLTHLPVIIDPSHATGIREKVIPMARAAIAAGADGLMIEVHHDPDQALSDGPQSLYPKQFGQLTRDIYVIAPVVGKQLDFDYLDKAKAVDHLSKTNGTGKQKAAFLGEIGTFSHKASTQYFGNQVTAVPAPSFKSIFESVKNGDVDFGVVPVENSLSGSIHENYDLLLEYNLRIVGEITLRIIHHLVGHPEAKIDTIRRVFSPPIIFQQCRQFLDQHADWELMPVKDTAGAVKAISEKANSADVAIASKEAAKIHGMTVIEEGIETNPRNYTRFVVIGSEPFEKGPKRKSSLIFSTGNQPGALYEVLKIYSENGINLVKLESRPIHGKPWEYMFYVDLEADVESEAFKPILEMLKAKTDYLMILGSY
ncbi:MAG: 3-deoxy-7-phosphoheptulonate synthase [Deltaproteobacteria bacterium]|nr:3-deoxy-7-phosphoheptulonate synthase [Deltaproteobacteria bacterium]MBW1747679.1 3-deoxy-7-phosphoheptulonate synthase [Deltaproteobacteria bacterium]MBW1827100.1 3-deoxy-7-phosphoheptulonate synthase [Deltaproteobacteria bacterium]MBW1969252.1 3-deoxy-7-phosphoheptulonate synthase [Deltaproteobacteria bacterium]MBW2197847.1 3-deoxy-7-phosphoheptulonate synthase [Deltaproteobacteria bacterium]